MGSEIESIADKRVDIYTLDQWFQQKTRVYMAIVIIIAVAINVLAGTITSSPG